MSSEPDLARALETARRAVEAASSTALRYFRRGVAVDFKEDRSPVTAADREAEAAILAILRQDFPEHDVLAEESGTRGQGSPSRWIVDPLDGTRGFVRGGSFWGPLVALEHRGQLVAGAMALPALGETYWAARGLGCYRDGERLQVSTIPRWEEATLSLGELVPLLEPPHGSGVLALVRSAASARCYGDVAGCALVLSGRAEAWLEAGVRIWDLAPHKILVEEAGGRFTDFEGRLTIETGKAIATNGLLHNHVLKTIASTRPPPAPDLVRV